VEPSEEIRRVVTRFVEAQRDGDEEAVRIRFSRQPGFERFGSDPDEVWHDGEMAARIMVENMRDQGGTVAWHLTDEVHAMSEGEVGWAGAQAEVDSPFSGGTIQYRFSCVLHLEHGEWKIVHHHSSVPTPNEEHGFFLTKSVDEIVEAVNDARPDLSSTSAPDGTVTIAFTDIEDSLKLNAFLGDQRWLEVLHVHNDVVTKVTADQGGTVVKGQGDGFMLAFPSARRALTCAQAIERAIDDAFPGPGSMIRVRIGIHVGETVQEADDFFGHAVNYAARIASAAEGGEIVVSELVHALVTQTGVHLRGGTPRGAQGHRRCPEGVPGLDLAGAGRAQLAVALPQHVDQHRSERPVLLAVDQQARRRRDSPGSRRTLRSGRRGRSRGA
jgi:class 3 adenylate cyclase/ketosteroid isomerase-like protein